MVNNKPMPRIGVDMYTLFPMLADGISGVSYGTAMPFKGTVEIAPTDNGATENFDADNGAYYVEDYVENMGHTLTNADIPPEFDAKMRGIDTVDGGVEVGSDTNAPYFGVAWRVKLAGGGYRLVRYYKGKYGFASSVGGKTKPSTGASEKQTSEATFTATMRDYDGKYYYYIDTNNLPEGVSEETAIAKWFSDMSWYPSNELLEQLSVVSTAGTNVGDTSLAVTPSGWQGDLYYKADPTTAPVVHFGDELDSTWTEIDSESGSPFTLTITNGYKVTVACKGTDGVNAAGSTTVVARTE